MSDIVTILSPVNNSVIERNYFHFSFNAMVGIEQFFLKMYYLSPEEEVTLVLDEHVIFPAQNKYAISPLFIQKDGLYEIVVRINDRPEEYKCVFRVKPEHGWETVCQFTDMSNKSFKNRCDVSCDFKNDHDILFINFGGIQSDGTLSVIDKDTFVVKKNVSVPNKEIVQDYKFFFWSDYIFRLKIDRNIMIEKYHLNTPKEFHNGWEHFASYASESVDSEYGTFINSNFQLVIFYKEIFRVDPSEIKIVIFDLNGDMKSLSYVNKFYNRNCFDLNTLSYLYSHEGKDVISIECAIPKDLNPENPDLIKAIVKFKIDENGLSLYEKLVDKLVERPSTIFNPIYMPGYNRIYWNLTNGKDITSEAWDNNSMVKNRDVPYGGTFNIKNMIDGKLYSVGAVSKFPGKRYLKRYIE